MNDDALFGVKTYTWDTVLTTGKYKNKTLLEVLKSDAAYLDWVKDNLGTDKSLVTFLKLNSRRIYEEVNAQENKSKRTEE